MPSPVMSASARSARPTERPRLDLALGELRDAASRFAATPVGDKVRALRECLGLLVEVAPQWAAEGARAKGLPPDHAEEWLAGPLPTIRMARLLIASLEQIGARGRPPLGTGSRTGSDGRLRIELFPASALDRAMYAGFSGYALMEEGLTREAAVRRQAVAYRRARRDGCLSLILGAGNVASIPPMDVFTKMFVDGSVCVLKMNPVNEWAGPILERALAPLIRRAWLRVVYGGADEGRYLVEHPLVDDVHITGSDRTHDAIVWGPPGPERDRRIRDNDPLLEKPITSELGNVSPVAIVPYTYDERQLWFQARNVATMVVNNASFNCNAAKLLVTSRSWAQRERFLELVARALAQVPTRSAYYPGAHERYQRLTGGRAAVQRFGDASGGKLAWTLVHDVGADDELLRVEPFCGILSETHVGSADPVEFLDRVTEFLNTRVWGTLNACLVVHPELEQDPTVARALDRAIVQLRYGTVAINHWPAVSYALAVMPWGGHPSANLRNIQSGIGWVHNTFMLDGVDKAVLRGPLVMRPHPPWFYDHGRARDLARKLVHLEAAPGWLKLPSILHPILANALGR